MVRILLVYEDFNELTLTESYLRKVGFDVVGIGNELLVQDQILSFHPEIIVAQGRNQRVSSFSVGQKLKDNQRFQGKVVIVVPKDVRPSPQDLLRIKMDGLIETPVQPEKLIQVLCRLAGLPAASVLEKFQKARLGDADLHHRLTMVTGGGTAAPPPPSTAGGFAGGPSGGIPASSGTSASSDKGIAAAPSVASSNVAPLSGSGALIDDPQRIAKYKQLTQDIEIDLAHSTHQRQDLKEKQKDLKKNWDFDKLEDQDQLRQQFAGALFKKK